MYSLIEKIYERRRGRKPSREAVGELAGGVGLACNILLSAVKFAAGLLSGSVAIVADAANNLSDAGASVMTLIGFKLSRRPADKEHPYGHARIENITGGIIAVIIILIGFEFMKSSIEKIIRPTEVSYSVLSFASLALSVFVKALMMRLYRTAGKEINSAALAAASDDSRNDVIATLSVLLAAAIQFFFKVNLDGIIGAAVAVFILISGFSILIKTLSPLLGEGPSAELVDGLYKYIVGFEGVLGLHDLMVHSYGPSAQFATVHIEMSAKDDPLHSHGIIDNIERGALERWGVNLVVHLDPIATDDKELDGVSALIADAVRSVDPLLSAHDIRLVKTHDHKKVIFDVGVPPSALGAQGDLAQLIREKITERDPSLYPVFTIDRNYNAPGGDD